MRDIWDAVVCMMHISHLTVHLLSFAKWPCSRYLRQNAPFLMWNDKLSLRGIFRSSWQVLKSWGPLHLAHGLLVIFFDVAEESLTSTNRGIALHVQDLSCGSHFCRLFLAYWVLHPKAQVNTAYQLTSVTKLTNTVKGGNLVPQCFSLYSRTLVSHLRWAQPGRSFSSSCFYDVIAILNMFCWSADKLKTHRETGIKMEKKARNSLSARARTRTSISNTLKAQYASRASVVVLVFTEARREVFTSFILAANKSFRIFKTTKVAAKISQRAMLNGRYWVFNYKAISPPTFTCSKLRCSLKNHEEL